MCMAPSIPGTGSGYWQSAVPGMTPEEAKALPEVTADVIYSGGIGGVAATKQARDAAMEKWKTENPERYQQGLKEQERAASGQPQRTQTAQNARQGSGASGGGGGASSLNTLLTSGTQGVDPSALDLSKNTLLGL